MEEMLYKREKKLISFLEQKKDIIHYIFIRGNKQAVDRIEDIIRNEIRQFHVPTDEILDIITRYSMYGEYRYNHYFNNRVQEYEVNIKDNNINDILLEEENFIETEIRNKILDNSAFSDYDGLATIREISNIIMHKNGIYYESEIEKFVQKAISVSLDRVKQEMNDKISMEMKSLYREIKESNKDIINIIKNNKEIGNVEIADANKKTSDDIDFMNIFAATEKLEKVNKETIQKPSEEINLENAHVDYMEKLNVNDNKDKEDWLPDAREIFKY